MKEPIRQYPLTRLYKRCGNCQDTRCMQGVDLPVPGLKGRRRYVCFKCIASLRSEITREALKEGTLSAPQVVAAQLGTRCPPECVSAASGHCSAARRAALRASVEVDAL